MNVKKASASRDLKEVSNIRRICRIFDSCSFAIKTVSPRSAVVFVTRKRQYGMNTGTLGNPKETIGWMANRFVFLPGLLIARTTCRLRQRRRTNVAVFVAGGSDRNAGVGLNYRFSNPKPGVKTTVSRTKLGQQLCRLFVAICAGKRSDQQRSPKR